jgi:magnesium transporter
LRTSRSAIFKEPDTFVWVALKDPDRAELEEMQRQFGLHKLVVKALITDTNG